MRSVLKFLPFLTDAAIQVLAVAELWPDRSPEKQYEHIIGLQLEANN